MHGPLNMTCVVLPTHQMGYWPWLNDMRAWWFILHIYKLPQNWLIINMFEYQKVPQKICSLGQNVILKYAFQNRGVIMRWYALESSNFSHAFHFGCVHVWLLEIYPWKSKLNQLGPAPTSLGHFWWVCKQTCHLFLIVFGKSIGISTSQVNMGSTGS